MIIAVCNQKGGQAKSTTAQAIATGATQIGRKSLAIDLDPQGNLTFSMGGNGADVGVYEFMTGQTTPGQTIQRTRQGDIITASKSLALADTSFIGKNRSTALAKALWPIRNKYDVITIDCPPTLNILLVNALMAADVIIIPITADMYALQGLYLLQESIQAAQKVNTGLKIGGVLFTKHNTRTVLARELTAVIKEKCAKLNIPVYNTVIRESVAIREAQTQRQNIFEYSPNSNPAKDYQKFIEELGL